MARCVLRLTIAFPCLVGAGSAGQFLQRFRAAQARSPPGRPFTIGPSEFESDIESDTTCLSSELFVQLDRT